MVVLVCPFADEMKNEAQIEDYLCVVAELKKYHTLIKYPVEIPDTSVLPNVINLARK